MVNEIAGAAPNAGAVNWGSFGSRVGRRAGRGVGVPVVRRRLALGRQRLDRPVEGGRRPGHPGDRARRARRPRRQRRGKLLPLRRSRPRTSQHPQHDQQDARYSDAMDHEAPVAEGFRSDERKRDCPEDAFNNQDRRPGQ